MSRQEAEAWITSHPLNRLARFRSQAEKLGPFCVPGMIEVLSDGPEDLHTQAGLVLTLNGVSVASGGDDENTFWILTLVNGEKKTVAPRFQLGADASDTAWSEVPHVMNAKDSRKLLLQYGLLFAVSVVLGVVAYLTHGITQVVPAIIAGVLFAVALWSTLYLTVVRMFQKKMEGFTPDR